MLLHPSSTSRTVRRFLLPSCEGLRRTGEGLRRHSRLRTTLASRRPSSLRPMSGSRSTTAHFSRSLWGRCREVRAPRTGAGGPQRARRPHWPRRAPCAGTRTARWLSCMPWAPQHTATPPSCTKESSDNSRMAWRERRKKPAPRHGPSRNGLHVTACSAGTCGCFVSTTSTSAQSSTR